jgi:hypothetical protein
MKLAVYRFAVLLEHQVKELTCKLFWAFASNCTQETGFREMILVDHNPLVAIGTH